MAYQALYRRFRPKFFRDMAGQGHIVPILKNQVRHGQVSHAYLFCGTRGTGKTSAAKIFARAINCPDSADGEPCGICEQCTDKEDVDILEIDAASNNGVDHIRDLREKVHFTPLRSRYKVYIIDEAHMLSSGAFNALLKTLEEPPAHVVFILATTEPQKLPATILSRCQRFDFHRFKTGEIAQKLQAVMDELGVTYDDRAVAVIARAAEGGLRDALSILDQCAAFMGEHISLADVLEMLGSVDQSYLSRAADAFIDDDIAALLMMLDEVVHNGKSPAQFAQDFAIYLRQLLLAATCGDGAVKLIDFTDDFETLKSQAERLNVPKLLRAASVLAHAESAAKWASSPRFVIETALVRMCRAQDEASFLALEERIAALEARLKDGAMRGGTRMEESAQDENAQKENAQEDAPPWPVSEEKDIKTPTKPSGRAKEIETAGPKKKDAAANGAQDDAQAIFSRFIAQLQATAPSLFMLARNATGKTLENEVLTLLFPEDASIYVNALSRESNVPAIRAALEKVDASLTVRFVLAGGHDEPDLFAQAVSVFGVDVVTRDE